MRARRKIALAMILVAVFAATETLAQTTTPQTVKLQGFLSDKSGGPNAPVDGTVVMGFELFDDEFSGALVTTAGPVGVEVVGGHYEIDLPFTADDFDGAVRWIQITVDGEVLSPRVRIESMPFAFVADNVDGHEGADLEESAEILAVETSLQGQIDSVQSEVDDLPVTLIPGTSTNIPYRDGVTGSFDASPNLTYMEGAGGGAFVDFDTPGTYPHNEYGTVLRWFPPADVDNTGSPKSVDYKFGTFCSDLNNGYCDTTTSQSCYTADDCPEGESCVDGDPQGACDWISRWCFNCGDAAGTARRNPKRHRFAIKIASHDWERGSCVADATEDCQHQAVGWDYTGIDGRNHKAFLMELRTTGVCQGGSRDGETCFPDDQLGCVSGGGTCSSRYDRNRFAWWPLGRWGYCSSDPQIECDEPADCPNVDCTTSSTKFGLSGFEVSSQSNLIGGRLPAVFEPYESYGARDLRSSGDYAFEINWRVAPGAGDTDGLTSALVVRHQLTDKSDPGGKIAGFRGAEIVNSIFADDNDVDVANVYGVDIVNQIAYGPGADNGSCCDSPASDNNVASVQGIRYFLDPSGTDLDIASSSGLNLEQPASLTDDSRVQQHYGILIADQLPPVNGSGGFGDAGHAAIDVRIQDGDGTAGRADKGNLRFWCQQEDCGHLQFGVFGAEHLWSDGQTLRFKDGEPTSNSDGGAVFYGECGAVVVDPAPIPASSHGSGAAAVPSVDTDGACNCSLASNFADGLLYQYCFAAAGELNVSLYNVSGAQIDPPARTVNYCCFEN